MSERIKPSDWVILVDAAGLYGRTIDKISGKCLQVVSIRNADLVTIRYGNDLDDTVELYISRFKKIAKLPIEGMDILSI
jgi:hypothetical protein